MAYFFCARLIVLFLLFLLFLFLSLVVFLTSTPQQEPSEPQCEVREGQTCVCHPGSRGRAYHIMLCPERNLTAAIGWCVCVVCVSYLFDFIRYRGAERGQHRRLGEERGEYFVRPRLPSIETWRVHQYPAGEVRSGE